MPDRLYPPRWRALDASGNPLPGAKLYTYEPGTSTPKATYSDAGLTVANANPVIANSGGLFGDIFLAQGDYKVVLQTATGSTVWTADPVDGGDSAAASATTGLRNLVMNGGFAVNQRAATSVADDAYCLDGWYALTNTGNVTIAQQTYQESSQRTNVRLTQPDVSAKRMGLAQIIEAARCGHVRGSPASMGARVRLSVSGTVRFAVLAHSGTADSVTSDVVNDWTSSSYTAGGFFVSTNMSVLGVGSAAVVGNTWTNISVVTSSIAAGMRNLIVMIWTQDTVAQNVTLDIGRVQLNSGGTLGAYEEPEFSLCLAECQRFYEKSFPLATAPAQNAGATGAAMWAQIVGASTNSRLGTVPFRVRKRAVPTLTLFNPSAANAQVRNADAPGDCSNSAATPTEWGFDAFVTTPGSSSAGQQLLVHWTAEASL